MIQCKLKTTLFLIFFFFKAQLNAQTITGIITTEEGRPISSATIALLTDSILLGVTTTGDDGKFLIKENVKENETYLLRVSAIGYQTLNYKFTIKNALPPLQLVLAKDNSILKEVSVTASKPVITRNADRYIINVENSFLSQGHSAIDILQKSPGVWVDSKGNIFLRGTRPVTVMINDVVQRMSGDELSDYLRSIPSADISSIEIIAQPPAEFEGEGTGGIVRIILKKAKSGFNGTVNAQYRQQGKQPYFTTGANLNYGIKKWYLLGSYTYTLDKRSIFERADIQSLSNSYQNITDRFEKILRNNYRLGLVYDINSMQSVSVQTSLTKTQYPGWFQSREVFEDTSVSQGSSISTKERTFDLRSLTLNYALKTKHSGNLKLITDYTDNRKQENNNYNRQKSYSAITTIWRNNAPTKTTIFTTQADYSNLLPGKVLFASGVKYADMQRDNRLATENLNAANWQIDPTRTSEFLYNEKLVMAYASMETSMKNFSVKAGLRAEETFAHGDVNKGSVKFSRSYLIWLPSIFLMKNIDSTNQSSISFSYNRRITRPSLSDLNPMRNEFNYYTSLKGNPNLLPEDTHNFSLSALLNKTYSAEFFFMHTIHSIGLSAYPGSDGSIVYLSENTGTNNEWGLNFAAAETINKEWTFTSSFGVDHSAYRFNGITYKQFSFRGKMLHTVSLERLFDFDVSASYYSPYRYTNLYTYGNFTAATGISKKLVKNKMRLRLEVNDIFNTTREKELTIEGNSRVAFYRKRDTRTVALTCSYNFNYGKKISTKKIEQGSAEERARTGN